MSKLAEKMRRAQRGGAASIGFGTAAVATKAAPLLLLARLSADDSSGVAAAVAAGADLLMVSGGLPTDQARAALAEGPGALWGVIGGPNALPTIEEIEEAGADFAVISAPQAPAAWMAQEEGPGWVLQVDHQWADGLLRAAGGLPIDALYLGEALAPAQLTVERALQLQRMAQLAQRPLLVPLKGSWNSAHLQALMAAGVLGVIVEGAEVIKELRPLVDQLPPRGQRPRGPRDALLPRPPEAAPLATPAEEEED